MKSRTPIRPRFVKVIILVMVIFFTISFITNILNSIIVDVKESFDLSFGLAGFLPFSFFIAYGVMSIPAGFLFEKYRDKRLLSLSFIVIIFSCLTFVAFPGYIVFTVTLFLLGCSMAVLQVIINPLLRSAGGEEHFAFNSVLAQLVFGLASYASPYLYIYLVNDEYANSAVASFLRDLVPKNLPWVSIYVVFALISIVIFIIIRLTQNLENFKRPEEVVGDKLSYIELLKNRTTVLYFLGIFCYVGVEQGIGNWISQYLYEYHQFDPQTTGANTVSYFWAMLTIGCLLGLLLLKLLDSRVILIGATILTILCTLIAVLGPANIAVFAFAAIGFFISVMWSIIFSLGMNSAETHHGSLSGILCTGIAGGAIFPLIIGIISDHTNLRTGLLFLIIPLLYILSIGFWANPMVHNKRISL